MSATNTTLGINNMHAVGVPVTDQDRSLEFFVDTLGFETRMDVPMPGRSVRWIEVAPPASPVAIALVAHVPLPVGIETGIRFTTPDAEADHAQLSARGVDVDDILRWPGVPAMFSFRDPDGNGYELVGE